MGAARLRARLCLACQPEAGQRHARETDAKFLQCRAARDRLGQALGEFIEFVVHSFSFVFGRPWFAVAVVHVLVQHGLLPLTTGNPEKPYSEVVVITPLQSLNSLSVGNIVARL